MSPRAIAALACTGVLVGVALTPFMAAVWAYEPGIAWSDSSSLVERAFGPWLESSGLLTFGRQSTPDREGLPYEVYGKGFFLVYLLMLPVFRTIRPADQNGRLLVRLAVWAWRAMYVAIWVAMVCDFVSYWGKSVPGAVGDALWSGAAAIEILTVMMLLLVITLVFAASSLIAKALPVWMAAALIAAIVSVVPVNVFVTGYWPNSFIVPISIGCATIAVGRLVVRRTVTAAAAQ